LPKSLNNNICEEAAFKEVYNTYADDVHNYLYYKYGTQYSPRDKAQEAFIKLWDNCKKVTFAKAKSFLFTVANNLMLNEIKHQKIVLKHQQQQPKHFSNESPEFLMEEAQYLERYNLVLSNMKEEYRVAFLMSKVEGKKHSEIADLLNVTQKVVEYRIYTAFNILKKELENFKIK
jgi:RNA polymerase sigma-70 factor (ECF subfamily)